MLRPAGGTETEAPPEHPQGIWATLREAVRGSHQDFTEVPVGRAVILLAVPMVLEMLMESVFAVADVFFVGRLGADAVATVGLTESLMTVIYAIAIGLCIGATATVARRIGEKDPEGASRAAAQSIALGLVMAAIIGSLGAIFATDLLRMMGATAEVIHIGARFTRRSASYLLPIGAGSYSMKPVGVRNFAKLAYHMFLEIRA